MFNTILLNTYSAGKVVQIARFRYRYLWQKNESEGNVVQIRCIKLSTEQASGLWRKTSLYSKFTNSIPNSKYQKTFYQLKVSDDLRAEINCLLAANCSAASRWQQNSFNSLTEREGGRSAGKGRWIDRALCKQSCVWLGCFAGRPPM